MQTFERHKAYFLKQLLITHQDVCIVTYRCGAVLYIDISYDSLTHGSNRYIEFVLDVGSNIAKSVIPVQNLFYLILSDAVQGTSSPCLLHDQL